MQRSRSSCPCRRLCRYSRFKLPSDLAIQFERDKQMVKEGPLNRGDIAVLERLSQCDLRQ